MLDQEHDLWFYDSPKPNTVVLGVTLAMVYELHADIIVSKPDSFKNLSSKIRNRYARNAAGVACCCGVALTCISDTALKKV